MPSLYTREIFIDEVPQECKNPHELSGIFATKVVQKVTSWTLGEILELAGLPADVQIEDLYTQEHEGVERVEKYNTIAWVTEHFDKDGKPVRLVDIKISRERTVTDEITIGQRLEPLEEVHHTAQIDPEAFM